jgi:hypothetical protein
MEESFGSASTRETVSSASIPPVASPKCNPGNKRLQIRLGTLLPHTIFHVVVVARAGKGWASLRVLLAAVPVPTARTALPPPLAKLLVHELAVVPPGEAKPTLQRVAFSAGPGQAIGVVG